MALAPTLLKELKQAVGVGAVVLSGLAVTAETGIRGPNKSALSIAGNVPSISVQLGPTTDPEIGEVAIVGQIPSLGRTLIVAPGLPDSEPELNDLTPTLVWQETTQPTSGLAVMQGLAPAVVGDTGQSIAITVGYAVISGLAPTVSTPAGEEPTKEPDKAEMAVGGLVPTLYAEITISPEQAALVFDGLGITQETRTGWTTVEPATGPTWLDIPNV